MRARAPKKVEAVASGPWAGTRCLVGPFNRTRQGDAISDVHLVEDIAQVGLDRLRAEEELRGEVFAGSLPWLLIAALAFTAGTLAALASWIGALFNTYRLDDKTWFFAVLVLGLFSLGWVAMIAYVIAGPDATRPEVTRTGVATTPGT
jgi:hypothetical protein